MAAGKTLLERIDAPDQLRREVGQDVGAMMRSVADHLTRMFNTRQGSVAVALDYGMPNLNDLMSQFPDALGIIRKSLQNSVEKYEPRLTRVAVRPIANEDDPFDLRFKISGRLAVEEGEQSVSFEALVGPSGRVKVWS